MWHLETSNAWPPAQSRQKFRIAFARSSASWLPWPVRNGCSSQSAISQSRTSDGLQAEQFKQFSRIARRRFMLMVFKLPSLVGILIFMTSWLQTPMVFYIGKHSFNSAANTAFCPTVKVHLFRFMASDFRPPAGGQGMATSCNYAGFPDPSKMAWFSPHIRRFPCVHGVRRTRTKV